MNYKHFVVNPTAILKTISYCSHFQALVPNVHTFQDVVMNTSG